MMVSSFKILSIYLLTNVSWWLGGIWANAKQTSWIFLILYPGLEYYLNTNDDWWWLKNDAFKSIGNRNIWILEKGETFFLVYACKRDLLGLVKYFWWCWFTDSAIWRQEVTRIIDPQIKLLCMPDWTVWFPKTIRKQINHLEHNIIGKHIWQNWKSIIGKYFISGSCSAPQVDTEL